MQQTKIFFLFLISLLIFGCNTNDDDSSSVINTNNDFEVETIIPTGEEKYLNTDSDYIFDQNELHTFEINIPESDYARINADPTAEEYVEGNLIFDGETISPVGIRYKGSIGAFLGCVSGLNWADPSGAKTCTKLSMKIKINWDGADTKFYGLKKLQFHSMNNDPTQMRERLGYWLFREMNVPAPRAVHARLIINGTFSGIYALVEQIDGRFTRENFDDGKGNLYKELWPLTSDGQAQTEEQFIAALKTNEDENPTAEIIRSFAEQVADAATDDVPDIITSGMDINKTLALAVVDRTIRNDDGAFHWYCNGIGNDCEPHNFYWYEDPSQNKVYLIPWDLDHAFENIINNANPVTPIADAWGEITNDCNPFSLSLFGVRQRSAACDKLVAGWVTFEEEYDVLKTEFIEGPFSDAVVGTMLLEWEEQIRAATIEADEMYGDALDVNEWESALVELKNNLEYAREN